MFQRKMKSEAVKLAKLLEKEKEKEKKTKPAKDKATVAQERLKQKERELNRKDRNGKQEGGRRVAFWSNRY